MIRGSRNSLRAAMALPCTNRMIHKISNDHKVRCAMIVVKGKFCKCFQKIGSTPQRKKAPSAELIARAEDGDFWSGTMMLNYAMTLTTFSNGNRAFGAVAYLSCSLR